MIRRTVAIWIIITIIPYHNSSCAIVSFWNGTFKMDIVQRMIFGFYGKTFNLGIFYRFFRDCPTHKHIFQLNSEIKMLSSGNMLLYYKTISISRRTEIIIRFRCSRKISLFFIFFQSCHN